MHQVYIIITNCVCFSLFLSVMGSRIFLKALQFRMKRIVYIVRLRDFYNIKCDLTQLLLRHLLFS